MTTLVKVRQALVALLAEIDQAVTEEMVDVAAKAIAWRQLTPKGRAVCDWMRDFSESERERYRADAREALEATKAP